METALVATKTEETKTGHALPEAVPEVLPSPREELGAPAGMPLFLQRFALSAAPILIQRDAKEEAREVLIDTTRGLTLKQLYELSLTLSWTGSLRSYATMPPHWDRMFNQCELLANGVGAVLGQRLTTYARMTLEPALGQIYATRDLVSGAMRPLETVYSMVESRLEAAEANLAELLTPVVIQGVIVSNRAEFDKMLRAARESPDRRIPGTPIIVKDERALRRTYEPLTDEAKAEATLLKASIDEVARQSSRAVPDLRSIQRDVGVLLAWLDAFEGRWTMNDTNRRVIQETRVVLNGASSLIIGKLAPARNVLMLIRLRTSEIESSIQKTLQIPPRPDPEAPSDAILPPEPSPALVEQLREMARQPETLVSPEEEPLPASEFLRQLSPPTPGRGAPVPATGGL
jgi:hypothetical protein